MHLGHHLVQAGKQGASLSLSLSLSNFNEITTSQYIACIDAAQVQGIDAPKQGAF
jgi:hypothetical protein